MQNSHRSIFDTIETYIDMALNLVAILMSYFFAVTICAENLLGVGEMIVPIDNPYTIIIIALNILAMTFVYNVLDMYRPTRYQRRYRSFPEAFKVNFTYYGVMAVIILLVTRESYRYFFLIWVGICFAISTAFLTFKRHLIKSILTAVRKKRHNMRKIIIVGDNTHAAKEYIREVSPETEYGTMILGCVGDKITDDIGVEKLGPFTRLSEILDKYKPTDVVFAIDAYDKRHLIKLVNMCDDRCIKVFFLPVIYGFFKSSGQIEQVGTIPLINAHATPLDNRANAILKRAVDIVGSLLLIILTAPVMLIAAIGVRLSSPGPVIFRQTRVGKMGKKFMIYKFRSMRVNSLSSKGWTTNNDARKTWFGTFIRKTAIDELPQFFNVLRGDMSLVGPRPEIPKFVNEFKEDIPLYMVKHYVKPGITGLAQIKGLRGDTSVEDRIHEDIRYIENWSFFLDIGILLLTPFKAFNKNEKYVDDANEGELLDDESTRSYLQEAPKKSES